MGMREAFAALPSPCYFVDEDALRRNLEILRGVRERTGCKILLAQKAFSMFAVYPMIGQYLDGTTASGLYEARLGYEEMPGKEVHVFRPAYTDEEMDALLPICGHIVFNSMGQWEKYNVKARAAGISCGIRVNPLYAEVEHEIYNPCAPGSRLGVTPGQLPELPEGVEGLHFHTLCEQGADTLERTLDHVERHFGNHLSKVKWLNMGGGHHITREGYDIPLLERCVKRMRDRYGVEVYLEPGEAVALNAGYLTARVLDVVENGMEIAILDASAACHMPDVLEMPYRPNILSAGEPGEKARTYRLAGPTCLAGDVIGDYSFDHALRPGELLVFLDMAIYSFCKNNTFNGVPLPGIGLWSEKAGARIVKSFGYEDFKGRLS